MGKVVGISVLCVVTALTVAVTTGTVITSEKITDWGDWAGAMEMCPEGRAAQGFQVQTERSFGNFDNTAVNGLTLFCGNPMDGSTPVVTSNVGAWGKLGEKFRCQLQGFINAFQLRVVAPQLVGDESATNNVRFFCSKNEGEPIEGDGESGGDWGDVVSCPAGEVVCGLRTQVQEDSGNLIDDTSLNNVALECCPTPA